MGTAGRGRATSIADVDSGPLLDDMGRLNGTIGRITMRLPVRSPIRAMLKTLTDQTREVATLATGNADYINGKPHGPPPGAFSQKPE